MAAPGAGAADCPGGVFSTLPSEGTKTFADDPGNCDSLFGVAGDAVGGRYAYAQGTSFSAPIVSAIASLVLQANPALRSDQVADVIRRSAHQTVGTGWNPHTGAGVVDALAAVTLARQYDTVPPTISFGVVRAGASMVTSVAGVDLAGPGEALAGPGSSTVETSTDDREFHVLSARAASALRTAVPLRPGARIWIRGTTCDGLHNCTTRQSGPFRGGQAAPAGAAAAGRVSRTRLPPQGSAQRACKLVHGPCAPGGLERARLSPLPDGAPALRRPDRGEGARPDGGCLPAAGAAGGGPALALERERARRARQVGRV